jgi:hypothetical protein
MTSDQERERTVQSSPHAPVLAWCPRCSMQLRQDEMDIHLAHSHNIGPAAKKEKGKDGRNRGRSSHSD